MKPSLVLELQALAYSNSSELTELLRKTLLVATKLSIDDVCQWSTFELSGYNNDSDIPDYRFVTAQLKARNPYYGYVPVHIDDLEYMQRLCFVPIKQPIGGLTDLLRQPTSKRSLEISFSQSEMSDLLGMQESRVPLEPVRIVGVNQVAAILDTVRTTVLKLALELERKGILGEGMTFSKEEKEKAVSNFHIQNFQGIAGDVSNSHVTQHLDMSVKAGDFYSLATQLTKVGVRTKEIEELELAIAEDGKPASKGELGTKVTAWLERVSTSIGTSAAGGTIARVIGAYFGF